MRCPFGYFDTLREKAPVHRFAEESQFGVPLYVVSRWEDCVDVLMRPGVFSNDVGFEGDSSGGGSGHSQFLGFDDVRKPPVDPEAVSNYEPTDIFFSDGADHRVKRSWLWPFVSKESLEAARPLIELEVSRLIDTFADDGFCDFRPQFSDVMSMKVVREVLGLPAAADKLVKRLSEAFEENDNNPHRTEEMIEELREAWMDVQELVADVIRDRAASPVESDYVSRLVDMQVARDGRLDVNVLSKQLSMTLFGAEHAMGGHLADIVGRLARDPDLQDRVRRDRSLVRAVSLECLRIETPVPWMFRRCVQDTTVGGVEVPAGSAVLVAMVAGNHDPSVFPSPAMFDVDRPNVASDHLSLGRGVHRCVGAGMAALQVEVTINALLDRLSNIRLVEAESDLVPVLSFGFRVPRRVCIAFDGRSDM
ncbi:cytochrome P450 [Nocardioides sp. AN3]